MNIHIPRWLIFSAIAAFALFEVVTHAPDFLNAFPRQQAQRQEYLLQTQRPNLDVLYRGDPLPVKDAPADREKGPSR
jgi:hypothetical protein